jgi:hypothetical protein
MAFEYIAAQAGPDSPATISRLRALVGDTREKALLLEDDLAAALLAHYGTARDAALPALDLMIAAQSNRLPLRSGGESVEEAARLAALERLREGYVARGWPNGDGVGLASYVDTSRVFEAEDGAEY